VLFRSLASAEKSLHDNNTNISDGGVLTWL